MDKKDKLRLSAKLTKDLEGFEDVIDLVMNEKELATRERKKREEEKIGVGVEILNFLETDCERVRRIDRLINTQIPNMETMPLVPDLVEMQAEHCFLTKESVIDLLELKRSPLQQNMDRLYQKFFS